MSCGESSLIAVVDNENPQEMISSSCLDPQEFWGRDDVS